MDSRLKEVGPVLPGGKRKRQFSDDAISKAMDSALSRVSPNKSGAIFRGSIDRETIGLVLAVKLGDQWSMGIILDQERSTGDWAAGFEVGLEF